MPIYEEMYEVSNNQTVLTSDGYSTDEVDFGRSNPNVGRSGMFGAHFVVTTTFTDLDEGAIFWITHAATASSTVKSVGRFMPVALLVSGFHFYVPGPHTLARYARIWYNKVSTAATLGKIQAWFGPDGDGAL